MAHKTILEWNGLGAEEARRKTFMGVIRQVSQSCRIFDGRTFMIGRMNHREGAQDGLKYCPKLGHIGSEAGALASEAVTSDPRVHLSLSFR